MDNKQEIKDSIMQGSVADQSSPTERVGLVVDGMNAAAAVTTITTAEEAGVRQIWMTQGPSNPDTLTIFAAAAAQTCPDGSAHDVNGSCPTPSSLSIKSSTIFINISMSSSRKHSKTDKMRVNIN